MGKNVFKVPKPTLEKCLTIEPHPYPSTYEEEEREDVLENGVVTSKLIIKQKLKRDRYKGLKASDFSIQSQIAAGVQGSPTFLGSSASIDVVDSAISAANSALDSLSKPNPTE